MDGDVNFALWCGYFYDGFQNTDSLGDDSVLSFVVLFSHLLIHIMQTPFGYTRKDVILIGVGITAFGYGLKYGLEVTPFSLPLF